MVQQQPVWVSWPGGIGASTTIPLKGGKRSGKMSKTRKSKKSARKATRKGRKGRKTTRRR